MEYKFDKKEVSLLIKCLIAFKLVAIILGVDYKEIKQLLKKLHGKNKENVFKEISG